MNTYIWKIENLGFTILDEGRQNVVNVIAWRFSGTDGVFSGETCGATKIELDETSKFIKYEDLTEGIVIGWLKSALGEEQIAEIKLKIDTQIQAQVEAQTKPKTGSGLPWGK